VRERENEATDRRGSRKRSVASFSLSLSLSFSLSFFLLPYLVYIAAGLVTLWGWKDLVPLVYLGRRRDALPFGEGATNASPFVVPRHYLYENDIHI
jgi:hypothetical protein